MISHMTIDVVQTSIFFNSKNPYAQGWQMKYLT
jgi:hypothetical protein